MRWLLVFLVGCVVHDQVSTLARWQAAPTGFDAGCATLTPFVRKTGRNGIGMSIRMLSHGDCDVAIGAADLHFSDGSATHAYFAEQRFALKGNSLIYAWASMMFANLDAWNEGKTRGVLVVDVTVAGTHYPWRIPMEMSGGDGHNAVGEIELNEPMPFENGAPARFVEASRPDYDTVLMLGMPYFLWGHGREHASIASRETGIDLHFEHTESGRNDEQNWGITASLAIGQWGPGRGTDVLGPLALELDYRWTVLDVGVGPAVYTERAEVGVQGSIRLPFGLLRARYMATSGIEVLAGFELPLFPVIYTRSR